NSQSHILRRNNIRIIHSYLEIASMHELYRKTDVFLSMHRAEGFGLPMLEAMAHGIPVVATGWSGNMDFMNSDNSRPVHYKLVPVADGSGIYSDSRWAEPDIAEAADALRLLYHDRDQYNYMARMAHRQALTATPLFPFSGGSLADASNERDGAAAVEPA